MTFTVTWWVCQMRGTGCIGFGYTSHPPPLPAHAQVLGREFEEMCAQMYYRGKMFGFVHLYSGQVNTARWYIPWIRGNSWDWHNIFDKCSRIASCFRSPTHTPPAHPTAGGREHWNPEGHGAPGLRLLHVPRSRARSI